VYGEWHKNEGVILYFDKLNAFLASATGIYLVKALMFIFRKIKYWLTTFREDQRFLIDDIKIKPWVLRLSHSRYNLNSKKLGPIPAIILTACGLFLSISSICLIIIISIQIIYKPIFWLEMKGHDKVSSYWISRDEATSTPFTKTWYINKDICEIDKELAKIKSINKETKNEICTNLLSKADTLYISKTITSKIYKKLIAFPIIIALIFYAMTFSISIFLDFYVCKKIANYRNGLWG